MTPETTPSRRVQAPVGIGESTVLSQNEEVELHRIKSYKQLLDTTLQGFQFGVARPDVRAEFNFPVQIEPPASRAMSIATVANERD